MKFLDQYNHLAHWALRLGIAPIFLYHGITKFPALEPTSAMLGFPVFIVVLLALAEVAAGILILAGPFIGSWATRIAALIVIGVMAGAIFTVHLANGWNFMAGGIEFHVAVLLVGIYLLIQGNNTYTSSSTQLT